MHAERRSGLCSVRPVASRGGADVGRVAYATLPQRGASSGPPLESLLLIGSFVSQLRLARDRAERRRPTQRAWPRPKAAPMQHGGSHGFDHPFARREPPLSGTSGGAYIPLEGLEQPAFSFSVGRAFSPTKRDMVRHRSCGGE